MDAPESRPYRKDRKSVPFEAALKLLNDLPRLFQALNPIGFNRSLPSDYMIRETPALAAFLQDMLCSDAYEGNCSSNPQLDFFHKKGWVHAEASTKKDPDSVSTYETLTYVFPSKLHRKKIEFLLLKTDFPHQKFQSVEELSFAALREFKRICSRAGREPSGQVSDPN